MWKDDNKLSFFFYSVGKKERSFYLKIIRKVLKEIQKLEKEKALKLNTKSKLEDEIAEQTTRLKYLYSLKSDYEKIEKGINGYFNPPSSNIED